MENNSYFSDLILEDLIKQGVPQDKLLEEFRHAQQKMKPAIQKMVDEAKQLVKENRTKSINETEELFGDLEET